MKLKDGVLMQQMNDEYVAVAADEAGKVFHGMLKLNQTAAFLVEAMQQETTVDALTLALCEKYEVSEAHARESVNNLVAQLRGTGLLDE